jgi:hypothetical protein
MYSADQITEIGLQHRIEEILKTDSASRPTVKTYREGKESGTLNALLGEAEFNRDFVIKVQQTLREKNSGTSLIFQGLIPDLIIAGKQSNQNRIVIEVKQFTGSTTKEPDASQFANYFFHLFATTDVKPNDRIVIPRAMIVAAPTQWFNKSETATLWNYLIDEYGSLAKTRQITLAEIHIEDCWS